MARREAQPHEESPEQPIHRAGFVEAHLVDEFFKYQRIVGEKIDAPFPVVETDGTGNDLRDPPGVVAADHAMLAHHALALVDGLAIPVLDFAAEFVHRIKAQITAVGDFRPEPWCRGLALSGEFRFHLAVPLGGAWAHALFNQLAVKFDRRLVEPQLNDLEIRRYRFEKLAKSGVGQLELDVIEIVEGLAKMNEHQVALVAQ